MREHLINVTFDKEEPGEVPASLDIVDRLAEEAGIPSRPDAEAALVMALEALGAMVSYPRRDTIAAALPKVAAEPFGRRPYEPEVGAEDLVDGVARGEQVNPGAAIEHLGAVLVVLRDTLSTDLFRVFVSELPKGVAALIPAYRSLGSAPPRVSAQGKRVHHLSDARPGSTHTVTEAASDPRAHTHSVAKTDDPHVDTKLSEAEGLTQGREHESLADAHPGAHRTLADPEDAD